MDLSESVGIYFSIASLIILSLSKGMYAFHEYDETLSDQNKREIGEEANAECPTKRPRKINNIAIFLKLQGFHF